jgi:hypothetical protein
MVPPERSQYANIFICNLTALVKARADRIRFLPQPTHTHADYYPACRKCINRREPFRKDYRIVLRQD